MRFKKPFTAHVEAEQTIEKGELLLEFDINQIEAAELPTITPVIVTNTNDYADVLVSQSKEATGTILTIKK